MVWIGICVGIILGILSHSFIGFLVCVTIGGLCGHEFGKRQSNATQSENFMPDDLGVMQKRLEKKIERLEKQIYDMAERLSKLEQHAPLRNDETITAPHTPPIHDQAPSSSCIDLETPTLTPSVLSPPPSITPITEPEPVVIHSPHQPVRRHITSMADIPQHAEHRTVPQAVIPSAEEAKTSPHVNIEPTHINSEQKEYTSHVYGESQEASWFTNVWQNWIVGGNPLLKMGVLILFLGLTFLLRYAAEHAVLPIEFRYAGVAATGISFLVFGWKWRERQDNYGLILQGLGIGVLYLTTLAAMKLHDLIPHGLGFVILLAITGYSATLAILQNSLALAIAGSLGGFATPVLVSQGGNNHFAFFAYLTVLNLGIVSIAWFKTWRVLNVLGFLCTFLLGSSWAAKRYEPSLFSLAEPFVLLFFIFYVLITFLFAHRTLENTAEAVRNHKHVDYVDGFLAFAVPMASFGWQYLLVKETEYGAAFSALAFGLIYIVLASILFKETTKRYALLTETLIALGVIFGSLAIPLGLENKWTSAAWAIEAAGMYWLGMRQSRIPARLFSLVLFLGSAISFMFSLGIGEYAVLSGSWLGCLLLAASARSIFWQMHQASESSLHPFELSMQWHMLRACIFFTGLLPFLVFPMHWAAPALAILGSLAVYASFKLTAPLLLRWGIAYQGMAGLLFLGTLRSGAQEATLAHGWSGLLGVCLLGSSLLGSVYTWIRQSKTEQNDIYWSRSATLGLLIGLAFINLAPLFILSLRSSLMVWSVMGIAILWWSIRLQHFSVLLFAFALEALSGLSYFITRARYTYYHSFETETVTPFLHNGFLAPLLISLAAFTCARLLQRAGQNENMKPIAWTSIIWASSWWAMAWGSEISRVIPSETAHTASLIGITLVSAGTASYLAKRWAWVQLGAITLAYLPALILIKLNTDLPHPFMGWCILFWSVTPIMHSALLKWQKEWLSHSLQKFPHVLGVWFFIVLFATECRWHFSQWGDANSAWSLLGWMIVPTAYLYATTHSALQKLWSQHNHHETYLSLATTPVVLYVIAWTWISNLISDGNAAPLPYLPLINPLELAHIAAMLGILLWYNVRFQNQEKLSNLIIALIGSTLFMLVTGMVMRTCHHWGGVPWYAASLLSSTLVQTSLSIVWGSLAIGLMVSVNKHKQRWVWITGALLMAIVIVKLFLVELSAHGSLGRIVSFIVVGMLLLLVGYFAPLPPKERD